MESQRQIVILGAGIIGLDVALVLAKRGLGAHVTILAQFLPGDTAPDYTSPWAGCNFSAVSGTDENALRWDRMGYAHLQTLASELPKESFVSRTRSLEYWDKNAPHDKVKTMATYLEDFQVLSRQSLPPGASFGTSYTSFNINAPQHLLFLERLLSHQYGVHFVRRRVSDLQEAFWSPNTRIVFNCTGNAARSLAGVQDAKCFPTRGQVVLVRAPQVKQNVLRLGKDGSITYIIPRPASNGNVILGGFMQQGTSDAATYLHQTNSILSRTTALCAELRNQPFEVLAAFAGMRPSRHGGARVERQDVLVKGKPGTVVHNYGAGGTGFQAGYGMALDAVQLVDDDLLKLVSSGKAQSNL
ncbi:hypothetical protein CDD82_4115 [Ophiocordyceps australis]|uniref:FAD dependent oxidoreductase domain-containing protein n=1 Tax=Ophiocordyceps australis TaxID=1399860 RepID=A0A2C5Z2X4_9HYPO|nr:hypothetical protein CDD82_4115 [Ophiocordyceps australis]